MHAYRGKTKSPNNYFDFSDFPANQCEDKDWTIFFTGNIGNEPVC